MSYLIFFFSKLYSVLLCDKPMPVLKGNLKTISLLLKDLKFLLNQRGNVL